MVLRAIYNFVIKGKFGNALQCKLSFFFIVLYNDRLAQEAVEYDNYDTDTYLSIAFVITIRSSFSNTKSWLRHIDTKT